MVCVCVQEVLTRNNVQSTYAYHVGSSKEGVICEVALSHRVISDKTG